MLTISSLTIVHQLVLFDDDLWLAWTTHNIFNLIVSTGWSNNFSQYLSECPIIPQIKQNVGTRSYLKLAQNQSVLLFINLILRFNGFSILMATQTLKNSLQIPLKFLASDSTNVDPHLLLHKFRVSNHESAPTSPDSSFFKDNAFELSQGFNLSMIKGTLLKVRRLPSITLCISTSWKNWNKSRLISSSFTYIPFLKASKSAGRSNNHLLNTI